MGNSESNIASGIKSQADSQADIYKLINIKGGGELIELTKLAMAKKITWQELEDEIRVRVKPFLYGGGEGKLIPVSELVLMRNSEREKKKQFPARKVAEAVSKAQIEAKSFPPLSEVKAYGSLGASLDKGLGKPVDTADCVPRYRLTCWDLSKRGALGETALLLCFLNCTPVNLELAKWLLKVYPKMINDFYVSDEYFGESSLHMAIVNEDHAMVKCLVDNGANYHQRCCGNFYLPEDQKASRQDSLEHEWLDVCVKTNYEGYVYWGEYPLSFAACLNQEESYRLLLARGANPKKQDINGNTVAHLMVIYNNISMFKTVYELGCPVDILNRQGLTPLTLAAKLGKKEIFSLLCKLIREIYWQLGATACIAFPLDQVDTINPEDGQIKLNSALNLVSYGDNGGHLSLLEGFLLDLLKAKWYSFLRARFYLRFSCYTVFYLITLVSFVLRPGPGNRYQTALTCSNTSKWENDSCANKTDHCFLLRADTNENITRFVFEAVSVSGATLYLLEAIYDLRLLGNRTFYENMITVPSRILFLCSCLLMLIMVPLRLTCYRRAEDYVAVCAMLLTSPYFLFFFRAFRMVGPFVFMIYKMILTDLLCFVIIYLVIVMGFSQAYFVLFRSYTGPRNYFSTPVESIMTMFVMSLTEFGDIYKQFNHTEHKLISKALFVMYMTLAAVLLVNMLIAMMGKTYQDIADRKNEWKRQWARMVLVMERGLRPEERLDLQRRYSQTMADGRRALVLKLNHTEEDKKELLELNRLINRRSEVFRRKQPGRILYHLRSQSKSLDDESTA